MTRADTEIERYTLKAVLMFAILFAIGCLRSPRTYIEVKIRGPSSYVSYLLLIPKWAKIYGKKYILHANEELSGFHPAICFSRPHS